MVDIKQLRELAKEYKVMCVDDNEKLQMHLTKFLNKFFKEVIVAYNGKDGVEKYLTHKPHLIITDIEMPEMNGLEMTKKLKKINKDLPIIIISAYDEKEYLLNSIRYGVVNYLTKPAQTSELSEVLFETLESIKQSEEKDIFVDYLQQAFDHQHNMIVLMEKGVPIIANPVLLEYFNVDSVEEFNENHPDLGSRFLEHHNFLYSNTQHSWYEQVRINPHSYFHVKMYDYQKKPELHHFLLHYQDIPDKKDHALLLLSDITSLDLLSFFEERNEDPNTMFGEKEAVKNVLKMLAENNVAIKIHNFYKGIRITNPAKIVEVDENTLVLKSTKNQLRASEYENFVVISSDAIPHFIICQKITAVNYDKDLIVAGNAVFMSTSPTLRNNIRVLPARKHTASFVFKGNEYNTAMSICDISVDAVKLEMTARPIGLEVNKSVELSMSFEIEGMKKIFIKSTAKVVRDHEHETFYHIVLQYDLEATQKKKLVDYIAKRQLEIIREFKSL